MLVNAIAFYGDISSESIVKGDSKIRCIAVALILAKVYSDRLMIDFAKRFSRYVLRRIKDIALRNINAHWLNLDYLQYTDDRLHW